MSSREWTLAAWGLIGLGVVVLVVVSARVPARVPTAGAVVARLARWPALRVVLVLGWMWLGWHAFAR